MLGKSTQHFVRSGLAVILVLLMCSSSAVGAVTVGSPAPADSSDNQIMSATEDPSSEITENVSVWERAALPFRADSSNAAIVIENPTVYVNTNSGELPVNKDLAIFNRTQTVTFTLQSSTPANTTKFSGNETTLLIAKLDENTSAGSSNWSNLDPEQARSFLTSENANNNATFNSKKAGSISQDGSLDVDYDLGKDGHARGSGHYVFFLVKGEGVTTSEGNLSVSGTPEVLGFDNIAVQHSSADSQITNGTQISPGQWVEIDTDSNLEGDTQPNKGNDSLHHALVVYHEDTYENSQIKVQISGEVDQNITSDQVTVEHSIKAIDGTAENQKPVSIAGVTIGNGTIEGPYSVGGIFDFVADRGEITDSEDVSEDQTLNGLVLTSPNQVTKEGYPHSGDYYFEAKENWKEGTYRYIYLAGNNSSAGFSTSDGTFELNASTSSDGGSDGDDDDNDNNSNRGSSNSDSSGSADSPSSTDEPSVTVSTKNGSTHVNIDRVKANSPVRVDFSSPVNGTDASIDGLEFNFSKDVENFSTTSAGLSKRPDNIVSDPTTNTLSYFSIDISGASDDDINRADISFTVSQEKLNSMSASPSQVRLYRFHNGHWQELETTYLGNGKFSAQTPGFSVFAVGLADDTQQSATETPDGPGEESTDGTSSTETPSDLTPEEEGSNLVPFAILILLVVAAMIGAAYYQRTQ